MFAYPIFGVASESSNPSQDKYNTDDSGQMELHPIYRCSRIRIFNVPVKVTTQLKSKILTASSGVTKLQRSRGKT